MQVYRNMRILSQAPRDVSRKGAPHHLIGFLSPEEEFSVAEFRKRAVAKIRDIVGRSKVPLVVGGSGLYAKALIDGLFPSPEADMRFRTRMQGYIARHGSGSLHERLSKIDPQAARKIHPNDSRRIIRALEIFHLTKRTMTELTAQTRGLKDIYDIRIFGLTMPRDQLYERINARVEEMCKAGLVREVRGLRRRRLSRTAKAVLGFNEIDAYLRGRESLEGAKELLKKNTRRLAKRQLTWFRADERIRWFDTSKMSGKEIIEAIATELLAKNARRKTQNCGVASRP
jgi:tRNA dimethylallyltransferase